MLSAIGNQKWMHFFPSVSIALLRSNCVSYSNLVIASFMTENCVYTIDWRDDRKKRNLISPADKKMRFDCHYVWHNNEFAIGISEKYTFILQTFPLDFGAKFVNSEPSKFSAILQSDWDFEIDLKRWTPEIRTVHSECWVLISQDHNCITYVCNLDETKRFLSHEQIATKRLLCKYHLDECTLK